MATAHKTEENWEHIDHTLKQSQIKKYVLILDNISNSM